MSPGSLLLVVGAGHAGAELAFHARECGWAGRIVLAGDEAALPYHRPPLSKAYLAGEAALETIALKSRAAYDKAQVEWQPGRRVSAIDRAASAVQFADGETLRYTCLALATGGRPRPLPAAAGRAGNAPNFHYLRTLADVDRIRADFQPGRRLAIIGGGYIGLEVAAVAVKHGLRVTLLEAAERVLARVTAPRVSAFYEQVHRAAGVDLRTGVQAERFGLDVAGRIGEVHCVGGERIPADLVIAGIGLLPDTELAAAAGLEVDDGIVVDACSRTSDPAIFAAGDCTRLQSPLYGRRVRLESVPNALEQARCAAATLCGRERRYDAVPWFWSDQYDLRLKMVGLAQGHERFVLRGSIEQRSFSAFYLQGRRVLAVDTVNRIPEFMLAKRLVAERLPVDPERLADDSVPLKHQIPA
jgi:3-phenylpropionate/trans-cinnamate dioxygenase ferredoxin reductase subunit